MPVTTARAETRLLLHNVSWETYERLLAESIDNCGTRFTYDEGNLEIMVVSIGHENPNRTLAYLAEIAAIETGRDFSRAGSTTFKRKDLSKGFEPDSSFYFRHADMMRDKDEVDLTIDPPPELTIEVDITSSSLNRFPIYASIGVEEVWRYDGERVRFHRFERDTYCEIAQSVVLPPMTAAQATMFLERARQEKAPVWDRAVRDWVRVNL
jgi:Uma2 family endonuclease